MTDEDIASTLAALEQKCCNRRREHAPTVPVIILVPFTPLYTIRRQYFQQLGSECIALLPELRWEGAKGRKEMSQQHVIPSAHLFCPFGLRRVSLRRQAANEEGTSERVVIAVNKPFPNPCKSHNRHCNTSAKPHCEPSYPEAP